jgi:hypothetical protein
VAERVVVEEMGRRAAAKVAVAAAGEKAETVTDRAAKKAKADLDKAFMMNGKADYGKRQVCTALLVLAIETKMYSTRM